MSKDIHLLWCTYVSRCTQTHLMQWLCRCRFDRGRSNRLLSHSQLRLVSSRLLLEINWRSLDSAEGDDDDMHRPGNEEKVEVWKRKIMASGSLCVSQLQVKVTLFYQLQHKVHTIMMYTPKHIKAMHYLLWGTMMEAFIQQMMVRY